MLRGVRQVHDRDGLLRLHEPVHQRVLLSAGEPVICAASDIADSLARRVTSKAAQNGHGPGWLGSCAVRSMTFFTRLAFSILGAAASLGATGCRGAVAESADPADAADAMHSVSDDASGDASGDASDDAFACPPWEAGSSGLPPCTSADNGLECDSFESYSVCVDGQWLGCSDLNASSACSSTHLAPEGSPCCRLDYSLVGTPGGSCCVEGRIPSCEANHVKYGDGTGVCPPFDAGDAGRD
jgi:hypothetical protein